MKRRNPEVSRCNQFLFRLTARRYPVTLDTYPTDLKTRRAR